MYIPYAYSKDECSENHDIMMEISKEINRDHCNCEMGAAGKQVGYVCPGTCLDYAYEKIKAPISLAWEIYGGDDDYSFVELNENSSDSKRAFKREQGPPSCFLQMGSKYFESQGEREGCFKYFNPVTKTDYVETTKSWSKVSFIFF